MTTLTATITEESIEGKFEVALEQKNNGRHSESILAELAKKDWHEKKENLDTLKLSIKDKKDFDAYKAAATTLFNELFELMTAPGVDEFINWINELTDRKNEVNAKKLRKYLVDNFSDESIGSSLEEISTLLKSFFENIGHLFSDIKDGVQKELRDQYNSFLNKPAEFENAIDSFLNNLKTNLEALCKVDTLESNNIDQLYLPAQVSNGIAFYQNAINSIVKGIQDIKPYNEFEKGKSLAERVKIRVSDLKACIVLLDGTGVAKNQDALLQAIFLKVEDEVVKYGPGVKGSLEVFLENKWVGIADNYATIKAFFTNKLEFEDTKIASWKSFGLYDDLLSRISDYRSLVKENPLEKISNYAASAIEPNLTKKAGLVQKFNDTCQEVKVKVAEEFQKLITEYSEKNIKLINRLAEDKTELKGYVEILTKFLTAFTNARADLVKQNHLIDYLGNSFDSHLRTYNAIRDKFNEALQKSDLQAEFDWLKGKLNGEGKVTLTLNDFKDVGTITKILSAGLVQISIEKQF